MPQAYGGEMSALLQIRGQLDKATERVAELKKALAANPGYPSIAANLDSAVRIQKKLEAQFEEAAASIGAEVCPELQTLHEKLCTSAEQLQSECDLEIADGDDR
jgi:hypothetical protein